MVENRLMLREEMRITRRQVEAHQPIRVTLRREEATVECVGVEQREIDEKTDTEGEY